MTRTILITVLLFVTTAHADESSDRARCEAIARCRIPNELVDLTDEALAINTAATAARDPEAHRLPPRARQVAGGLDGLVDSIRKNGLSATITKRLRELHGDARWLDNVANGITDESERRTLREKTRHLALGIKEVLDEAEAESARPAPPARRYIGDVENRTKQCPGKSLLYDGDTVRLDFLGAADGTSYGSVVLAPSEKKSLELPAGAFDVRAFVRDGSAWRFAVTTSTEIKADGWHYKQLCADK